MSCASKPRLVTSGRRPRLAVCAYKSSERAVKSRVLTWTAAVSAGLLKLERSIVSRLGCPLCSRAVVLSSLRQQNVKNVTF